MGLVNLPVAVGWVAGREVATVTVAGQSAPVPLAELLGIAIGGAVVLFGILASIAIYGVRRKHRRKKNSQGVQESGRVSNELPLESNDGILQEKSQPIRPSFNPHVSPEDIVTLNEWIAEDRQHARKSKLMRFSPRKAFRMPSVRDSWPLANSMSMPNISIPLARVPPAVGLSPVAPPGYELPPEPKWPTRTTSRYSTNASIASKIEPDRRSYSTLQLERGGVPDQAHRRCATSESQLSSILRSTSERLKASQGNSMSRATSMLSMDPGLPPTSRLPSPPHDLPKAFSRRNIEADCSESVRSSIYEAYLVRTPSPDKKIPRSAGQVFPRLDASPTPSIASDEDSLCGRETPEIVIPATLTSPSKRDRRKRRTLSVIIAPPADVSAPIQRDSRASVFALGNRDSIRSSSSRNFCLPQRISLSSDPFFSTVKSAKPVIPHAPIIGPRPLYIRRSKFGQEATTERPLSFTSPLQDISGNMQGPRRRSQSPTPESKDPGANPFRWTPQEAMKTKATSPQGAGSRKSSRQRSISTRTSGLPRPPSVGVVPEESEEENSPQKYRLPFDFPARAVQRVQSYYSLSVSSHPPSVRPPSAPVFSPRLNVLDVPSHSNLKSPSPELEEVYSPTLSGSNYYYSENPHSEEEFFNSKSIKDIKEHRTSESLIPESSTQIPFRPLSFQPDVVQQPNSYPTSSAAVSGARVLVPSLISKSTSTASSSAATSIPRHPSGPRTLPPKSFSTTRETLQNSICMLRRMNSEVSTYSTNSVSDVECGDSPTFPAFPKRNGGLTSPTKTSNGQIRGTENYLAMGASSTSLSTQRRSDRLSGDMRAWEQRTIDWSQEASRGQDIPRPLTPVKEQLRQLKELTPVKEDLSPPEVQHGLGIQNLKFPTLSSAGTMGDTPPTDKDNIQDNATKDMPRWSDVMPKPVANGVRRESKMQHPTPRTQQRWKWGSWAVGIAAKKPIKEVEIVDPEPEPEPKQDERPDSLGLYDIHGFLKCSPEKNPDSSKWV